MSNTAKWPGLILLVLGLLAVPAWARIQKADVTGVFLPGADFFGNPSNANGGSGPGKIYKNSFTGVLVLTSVARVGNDYRKPVKFDNLGFVIDDPFSPDSHFTTQNSVWLKRPSSDGVSTANCVASYNP